MYAISIIMSYSVNITESALLRTSNLEVKKTYLCVAYGHPWMSVLTRVQFCYKNILIRLKVHASKKKTF